MSAEPDPAAKPKLIVDDDWKTRVEAEKAALQSGGQPATGTPATGTPATGTPATGTPATGTPPPAQTEPRPRKRRSSESPSLPPASWSTLVTLLATQALVAMGQIPVPGQSSPELKLDEAKHFIDLLAVLEDKTQGNRSADESLLLENILHELRMAYVAISKQ